MDGWDKLLRIVLHNSDKEVIADIQQSNSKYPIKLPKISRYKVDEQIDILRELLYFLPEEEFDAALDKELICNDYYDKDWAIYNLLTKIDTVWKRRIYEKGPDNSNLQKYGQVDVDSTPVIFEICDASGLLPKETKTASNPLVCVYYQNLTWCSRILKNTIDPKFEFSFPLMLKPNEVLKIVVWNVGRKLRFLGQIDLTFDELSNMTKLSSIKLKKRGRFSHVKGTVSVKVTLINKTFSNDLIDQGLQLVPFNVDEKLKVVLQRILKLGYKDKKGSILQAKDAILKLLKRHWGITDAEISEIEFETIANYYLEDLVSLKELSLNWQRFTANHDKDSNAAINLQAVFISVKSELESHIGDFINLMSSMRVGVPKSGQELAIALDLMLGIEKYIGNTDPKQNSDDYIQNLLKTCAENYYTKLNQELGTQENQFPLLDLTDLIIDNLETLSTKYDVLLLKKIHPPSIVVNIFYGHLKKLYKDFAQGYQEDKHELYDILELYKQVRKLQRVSEQIDFKLADQFPMSLWFKPFVEKWFINSSNN